MQNQFISHSIESTNPSIEEIGKLNHNGIYISDITDPPNRTSILDIFYHIDDQEKALRYLHLMNLI